MTKAEEKSESFGEDREKSTARTEAPASSPVRAGCHIHIHGSERTCSLCALTAKLDARSTASNPRGDVICTDPNTGYTIGSHYLGDARGCATCLRHNHSPSCDLFSPDSFDVSRGCSCGTIVSGPFSEELRALARQAIVALESRKNEDIAEWARRLAESVCRLTD